MIKRFIRPKRALAWRDWQFGYSNVVLSTRAFFIWFFLFARYAGYISKSKLGKIGNRLISFDIYSFNWRWFLGQERVEGNCIVDLVLLYKFIFYIIFKKFNLLLLTIIFHQHQYFLFDIAKLLFFAFQTFFKSLLFKDVVGGFKCFYMMVPLECCLEIIYLHMYRNQFL